MANGRSGSLDNSGQPRFDGSVIRDKNTESGQDGSLNDSELDETVIAPQIQGHLNIAGPRNRENPSNRNRERLDNTVNETMLD